MIEYPFYIDAIGAVAGTLTSLAFLPQVVKVIKTKSTKDISLGMFIIFSIGVLLWFVFGALLGSAPLIFTNGITLVSSIIILRYKIKYG
jgi:MtN3 and saliva related transmembrane protein